MPVAKLLQEMGRYAAEDLKVDTAEDQSSNLVGYNSIPLLVVIQYDKICL